jgi:glucose/arabinose dehydrogenase
VPKANKRVIDIRHELVAFCVLLIGTFFAFGADTKDPVQAGTKPVEVKSSYVIPSGEPETIIHNIAVPWEIVFLPDGMALVDERDTGNILQISKDYKITKVAFTGTKPPCEKFCEGGTLGMAVTADRIGNNLSLFVFLTTLHDNRILKYDLDKIDGTWALSNQRVILSGIDRSGLSTTHNGGRLAIGPDGKLWVSLGDAGMKAATSQNWNRLAGSVLRLNLDGSVPQDNPNKGSYVWAKGLRDTQGMAWDEYGNMWTTEFGQDTWDELNLMQKGKNYGWPLAEGKYKFVETPTDTGSNNQGTVNSPAPVPKPPVQGSDQILMTNPKYTSPVLAWHPIDAACSGITYTQGTLISACLRGSKLWVIPVIGDKQLGEPQAFYTGQFGRLRKAAVAPDGSLWILTSNRDGRRGWSKGGESAQDDRIIRVQLKKIYN